MDKKLTPPELRIKVAKFLSSRKNWEWNKMGPGYRDTFLKEADELIKLIQQEA